MRRPTLLLRQVDQDDIGILKCPIEDNVFPVRRDVEAAQRSLVAEMCDLASLALGEIKQPEVARLRDRPVTRCVWSTKR